MYVFNFYKTATRIWRAPTLLYIHLQDRLTAALEYSRHQGHDVRLVQWIRALKVEWMSNFSHKPSSGQ